MTEQVTAGAVLGSVADDLAAAALTFARRFRAGATLWSWSPTAPAHARHVAVEFVHPVIVGKRALPAVAVVEHDVAAAMRPVVRNGDLFVAVSDRSEADVVEILRRATAWGLTTAWIGAGDRPEPGAANHVLWVEDGSGLPAYDGRFVLMYHLLWELTHVCFEHPGLLGDGIEPVGEMCVTCSDEGRLAEVVSSAGTTATVRTPTGLETIDTTVVAPVIAGDLVVVHAGVAITVAGGP